MFNNSSLLPSSTGEASGDFNSKSSCILWHLQNNSSYNYDRAQEACSMYTDFPELGTGMTVAFWLTGIHILISNAAVLWGIIRTPAELRKQLHILMANLAVADLLAGTGLFATVRRQAIDREGLAEQYFKIYTSNTLGYTQMMSASALCLLSISSYVAIRHPIFFHTHAHSAKRDAGVAIVSSWFVFSLLSFMPSMGWNCLDKSISKCLNFYPVAFVYLAVTVFLLLICVMVFANVSVFLAIKERQKRRLGQPGGQNDPGQNSASQDQPNDAAERKYQKSVQKTRTVLIQVVSAIIFWLVPMIFILSCKAWEKCPLPTRNTGIPLVAPLLLVLNSAINPVASIIRTPDLRTSLRQDATAIYQALVTMMRGNRVNPQDEQAPPNQRGGTGAASGSERNMPTGQPATGPEVTRSNQGIADSPEIVELV
ncbi:PREDICTED: sphingosine 1-phosphate receptor 1-like [Branchiostoma belcheri]|uniref:Sphingosine 1-phosphate receptor 1-like n=1 Tax=Branchiostoma belcheri TaxID=7741 RepID=A0A6P4YE85_BRABE|nr:PREDICTED: sphingosine 1-phosphate receptor 1-like [Branchiostoma belcheri]